MRTHKHRKGCSLYEQHSYLYQNPKRVPQHCWSSTCNPREEQIDFTIKEMFISSDENWLSECHNLQR